MPFVISSSGEGVDVLVVPGGPELPAPGWTVFEDSGIVEGNPDNGPTATVRFKVYWQDRISFVQQLLGFWSGAPPTSVSYVGPYRYPLSMNLLCTSVNSMVPHGKPIYDPAQGKPWLVKTFCIVEATFTRPAWQGVTSGGYFSITFGAGGEAFTLPETVYRFGDGTPTATPLGIIVPQAEITVKRFRMPFIPDQQVATLLATPLNNAPFQIGNNVYPAGTLLFSNGDSSTESDVLGNLTYTFDYRFLYKSINWNYSFHPDRTTGWASITDGNGNPPFQSGDFNILP
jgi:hypothetical protein